jgi:hypothetical protein
VCVCMCIYIRVCIQSSATVSQSTIMEIRCFKSVVKTFGLSPILLCWTPYQWTKIYILGTLWIGNLTNYRRFHNFISLNISTWKVHALFVTLATQCSVLNITVCCCSCPQTGKLYVLKLSVFRWTFFLSM